MSATVVSLLRDSLPYAAALAVSVLYFRVGVILSSLISSEAQTGYYSLAFRIVELVSGVPWLLVGSAFPVLSRAARDDSGRLRYALGRTYEVSLILGVWTALAIGLGAPFAVEVLGGREDFEPSIEVLSVLGGAMVGTFLIACWGHGLLTLRRHIELLVANLSAFVLGTALAVVLISAHGALGSRHRNHSYRAMAGGCLSCCCSRARPDLRPRLRLVPAVALAASIALAAPSTPRSPPLAATVLGSCSSSSLLAAQRQIPRSCSRHCACDDLAVPDVSFCVPVYRNHPTPNLASLGAGLAPALGGFSGELVVALNGISEAEAGVPEAAVDG